ncbi:MAG TPA: cytochrome c [Burkholderiaceae bacterium]|jgi:cytochrome c6|nr:cytochrome c [Burkholderiaceae bacterium]
MKRKRESIVKFSVSALMIVALARPASAEDMSGKTLFLKNCSACHQVDGRGIPDAFPALAGNPFVQGSEAEVVSVLLTGRNGMPNFSKRLTDQDVAQIVSYIRNTWGNRGTEIAAGRVATLRADLHAEAFDPTQQNIRH